MKSITTAALAFALSASAVNIRAETAAHEPAVLLNDQELIQMESAKLNKRWKKFADKAVDFVKTLNPLSEGSIVNIKGMEPKSQLHRIMKGITTEGIVQTILADQLQNVDPEVVEEIKGQSFTVAMSSVMHCTQGRDIAMLALQHADGVDPTEMLIELVDGKEDCMANFLIKEAER